MLTHCFPTSNAMGESMADDALLNKAASIERCVMRAREEYDRNPDTFATDLTRQDATRDESA